MAGTMHLWTPPAGMHPEAVKAWRSFYGRALDEYGITPEQYRLLYVAQKGRCWICRKAKGVHPDDPKVAGGRRLGVDHDHMTGAVRGLLCTGGDKTCNRVIGWLDGPALQRAADYRAGRTRPAWVLTAMETEMADAEYAGTALTTAEVDALAVAYLWPEGE